MSTFFPLNSLSPSHSSLIPPRSLSSAIDDRRQTARSIGILRRSTFRDRLTPQDTSDFYRFDLAERNQVQLRLNRLTAHADLQLQNQTGKILKAAAAAGKNPEFLQATLGAGTYYVRVFSKGDRTRYQLKLAAAPPPVFPKVELAEISRGFQQPTHIASANDGSDRLFVVEQAGVIRLIQKGKVRAQPFLDIRDRVQAGGEQGLLSMAFPPNYAQKQHFYVYYTDQAGNITVSRFRLNGANQADPASEEVIITVDHPTSTNHNGGQVAFGPDGYLYIGTGDGGGSGDPANNAQNPNSLLGKLLRIDVESPSRGYTIPNNNPFVGANQAGRDEIWALGLRNPWRFSFDRQTGDLYVGDVGQNAYEEIDVQSAGTAGGQNYGWNLREGKHPFNNASATAGLTDPVWEYSHAQGESITGGFVYRGSALPKLRGSYLYGDFINGKIWGLRQTAIGWQNQLLLDSPYTLSSFGQDESGNLYVADYNEGRIYQIIKKKTAN